MHNEMLMHLDALKKLVELEFDNLREEMFSREKYLVGQIENVQDAILKDQEQEDPSESVA